MIPKLDLHEQRHEDARRDVIRFIEEHWDSGLEAEIITGNSKKMKELVIDVLDEYGLIHQISRPFDMHNQGYIITWFE
jgi:hypothetical protein